MAKKRQHREQPKVALIYLRVSTREQLENLSMQVQESRCNEWCSNNGYEVAGVFHDDGVSARTVQRPAFQQMLSFIRSKKGAIGYVVVHDLSRFARNMDNQIEVMAELQSFNVLVRSVMEEVDETAAGKMVSNMHGLINQFFSDRNAERTKVGMEKSARIGRFPFKAPLGYMNVRPTRDSPNLIPDPERAPLITKAFELYGNGTETRSAVLRQVTLLGLTTQTGRKLTAQSFENLLRNPIYAGWVAIPAWNLKERGTFKPLVTEELFDKVQDIMDGKRTAIVPHIRNHDDFPLRVFVSCEACGQPLTGSWSKGRKERYPYYRCRNTKCKAVNVRKEVMERQFIALLHRLSPSRELLTLFRDVVLNVWRDKQADAQAQLAVVRGKLSTLTDRKNALMDKYLDGRIDQNTYDEQSTRLSTDIADTKTSLRAIETDDEQIEELLDFADGVLRDPAGLWAHASLNQRQRLQKVLFPNGLAYAKAKGFGTAPTLSIFNMLEILKGGNSRLVSPMGFEPMLSP
jgi:site-specific DNA recombinase